MQAKQHGLARLPAAYWFTGALAIVTLVKSAAGALFPGIFRDPPMPAGNAQGTDLVILAVALPVLVISMYQTWRGSWRALLVWLGALSCLLYNGAIFSFGTAFNPLFLVYVAYFSLSLWSLVALLMQVDAEGVRARFAARTPVKAFAVYMLFTAAIFLFTWLRQILPAIFNPGRPAFLAGTDMLTNPIHVLDLGFALPVSLLGAVWLWQRKPWGYVLAGLMLAMLAIETTSIAVDQWFGHLSDPSAPLDAVPIFVVLTLVGVIVVITYLRYLDVKSQEGMLV